MKNRILLCVGLILALVSCGNNKYSLLTDDGKTFCVNGIPATEGHEKIIKSLEDMGFVMDSLGVQESEYRCEKSALFNAKTITKKQLNKLTGGLFDDLPSTSLGNLSDETKFYVYLSWYKSGVVKEFSMMIGEERKMPNDDIDKINERLMEMFGYSKVIDEKFGYKKYYNVFDVECLYYNQFSFRIIKEDKEEEDRFEKERQDALNREIDSILNSIQ